MSLGGRGREHDPQQIVWKNHNVKRYRRVRYNCIRLASSVRSANSVIHNLKLTRRDSTARLFITMVTAGICPPARSSTDLIKPASDYGDSSKGDWFEQTHARASIPMGQEDTSPQYLDRGTLSRMSPGGHYHECPPNISRVISATFYPCNIFLISWKSFSSF